jgi:hypothetical protein
VERAIVPVVLVHGGAGTIPPDMNEGKFIGRHCQEKSTLYTL